MNGMLLAVIIIISYVTNAGNARTVPCQLRRLGDSGVCVCNETVCDTMNFVRIPQPMGYALYMSSKAGDRFKTTTGYFTTDTDEASSSPKHSLTVSFDRTCTFQRMEGWGTAMTGAVSIQLQEMTPKLRHYVYRDYFSRSKGAHFTWLRMPIGGCDFDLEPWQYNSMPVNDIVLADLDELNPLDVPKVQQIQEIKEISGMGDELRIMFSAWSPPRWMKTNNEWSGESLLLRQYYPTWALFHVKYLRLMKRHNITAYAITTGNEPLNGRFLGPYVTFLSLGWTPSTQGEWLLEHLGPAIRQSEFADVKIFANDDQRYTLIWWMELMGEESLKYIDAIAVHWYTDLVTPTIFLDLVAKRYPDKPIMNTEASCGAPFFDTPGILLGSWERTERVLDRMIQDFRHQVNGWIEWNMVLDTRGGPNYVGNYVDAPIIFNRTAMEYYKEPWFYAYAHFSKFIKIGSVRIASEVNGNAKFFRPKVSTIAFLTPNGTITLILWNKSDKMQPVTVRHDMYAGDAQAYIQLQPRSINTMTFS